VRGPAPAGLRRPARSAVRSARSDRQARGGRPAPRRTGGARGNAAAAGAGGDRAGRHQLPAPARRGAPAGRAATARGHAARGRRDRLRARLRGTDSFTRAFRGWEGTTPARWRAAQARAS